METVTTAYTTAEELRNAYLRRGWREYQARFAISATVSRMMMWAPNSHSILVCDYYTGTKLIVSLTLYTADEYS